MAGAAGTGGASGAGGGAGGASGAGGGAGSPPGYSECQRKEDCALAHDCCTCAAVREGEGIVACPALCVQSACMAAGITEDHLACLGGRCVIDRSCEGYPPMCGDPAPECGAGRLPTNNGDCWGPCVEVRDCNRVANCEVCTAAGLACVTFNGAARCTDIPPECEENPTCACVGACTGGVSCVDPTSTDLRCVCLTC